MKHQNNIIHLSNIRKNDDETIEWIPVYPHVTSEVVDEEEHSLHEITSTSYNESTKYIQPSSKLEDTIEQLSELDGFIAAAIVDANSGFALISKMTTSIKHSKTFDVTVAAAANTDVIKAKMKAKKALNLEHEPIEDILITLGSQYHLLRPSAQDPMLFIYLALDKASSNLALARHFLVIAEQNLNTKLSS